MQISRKDVQKMKSRLRWVYLLMVSLGIDLRKTINAVGGIPHFFHDLHTLRKQSVSSDMLFPLVVLYPCIEDRFSESGTAKGHYFHQDLLVAQRIYSNKPIIHVDIGSCIEGFVAHVASYRRIEVIDIRPLSINIKNIKFSQIDIVADLQDNLLNYCDSLSCLHALEHFGLGRYGDRVNFNGHIDGLNNIYKILQKNGKFYFSAPIGPQRIEFNAHRVFSLKYLIEIFQGKFSIDYFAYVDDRGNLHENVMLSEKNISNNYDCNYGCGIFEMTKI
ncbi:MAG: DUF268 domain-containing protein [Acetobacterium woodii]|nr:DUF268 domain-containing protein [Acetobacterium woodii]MBI5677806.1 DUF268 domain-containing protein [Planctomycetota bacterium]